MRPPRIAPGVASERRLDKGRARLAERKKDLKPEQLTAIREALGARSIVLIGLMGAGKTAVGRRLAAKLDLPFTDADTEIEAAAGQTVSEIFAEYGEPYFRKGESRVIARPAGRRPAGSRYRRRGLYGRSHKGEHQRTRHIDMAQG